MANNAWDDLNERGFIYQSTDEVAIKKLLSTEKVTFYIGFDPTADSLHVGHLLPIMAMRRMQKFGHKTIALVGGATGMIGDPSGKTESRPVMTPERLAQNVAGLKKQMEKFINVGETIFEDNSNWFSEMKYLDFLREVGTKFSINRMLQMDSVKMRLESSLSFLEFNYMLLQSYDFYVLRNTYNCRLQMGGQDQWGNIVSGTEFIRRMGGNEAYGLTMPLLLNSQGQKFGKSVAGAIWLDPQKMSIFDYYQFWRNCSDEDCPKLLKYFTALPVEEINRICAFEAPKINRAKEILAYEATALAHGQEEASKAYLAAGSKFGFADPKNEIETSSNIIQILSTTIGLSDDLPTFKVTKKALDGEGYWIIKLLTDAQMCQSSSQARQLIAGGGCTLNEEKILDVNFKITQDAFTEGVFLLKAGKKQLKRIVLED